MSDLSYTNKDGLDPAAGFENSFNIKNTDNLDFFGNGNTFNAIANAPAFTFQVIECWLDNNTDEPRTTILATFPEGKKILTMSENIYFDESDFENFGTTEYETGVDDITVVHDEDTDIWTVTYNGVSVEWSYEGQGDTK